MSDYPNTEATISEIMGALTLRVLWAIIKTVITHPLAKAGVV